MAGEDEGQSRPVRSDHLVVIVLASSLRSTPQYVGVVPVLESINNWKQETRTELIR